MRTEYAAAQERARMEAKAEAPPADVKVSDKQTERLAELRGKSMLTPAEVDERNKLAAAHDAAKESAAVKMAAEAAPKPNPKLKLFVLKARDRMEPPFYHSNMAHTMYIAAEDVMQARRIALTEGDHWADDVKMSSPNDDPAAASSRESLTTCEELQLCEPGVIAVVD